MGYSELNTAEWNDNKKNKIKINKIKKIWNIAWNLMNFSGGLKQNNKEGNSWYTTEVWILQTLKW